MKKAKKVQPRVPCTRCGGHKLVNGKRCATCHGRGDVKLSALHSRAFMEAKGR